MNSEDCSFSISSMALRSESKENENPLDKNENTVSKLNQWFIKLRNNHFQSIEKFAPYSTKRLSLKYNDIDTTKDSIEELKTSIRQALAKDLEMIETASKSEEEVNFMGRQIEVLQEENKRLHKFLESFNKIGKYSASEEKDYKILLRKVRVLDNTNILLESKVKALKRELKLKDSALEKAQVVIKELYERLNDKSHTSMDQITILNKGTDCITKEKMYRKEMEELMNKFNQIRGEKLIKEQENLQLKEQLIRVENEYKMIFGSIRNLTKLKQEDLLLNNEVNAISIYTSNKNDINSKAEGNPLVGLLVVELERNMSREYEERSEDSRKATLELENTCNEVKTLISYLKSMENEVKSNEKYKINMHKLISEAFYMLEQYNSQAEFLKNDLIRKKQMINELTKENYKLRDKMQEDMKVIKELNETKKDINILNVNYEKYKEKYEQEINNNKDLKYILNCLGTDLTLKGIEDRIKILLEYENKYSSVEIELQQCQQELEHYIEKSKKNEEEMKLLDRLMMSEENNILKLHEEVNELKANLEEIKRDKLLLEEINTRLANEVEETRNIKVSMYDEQYYKKIIRQKDQEINNLKLNINGSMGDKEKIKELKKALDLFHESHNIIAKQLREKNSLIAELKSELIRTPKTNIEHNELHYRTQPRRKLSICDNCNKLEEQLVQREELQAGYKQLLQEQTKELSMLMIYVKDLLDEVEPEDSVRKIAKHSNEVKQLLEYIREHILKLNMTQKQYYELLAFLNNLLQHATKKSEQEIVSELRNCLII